MDPVALESLIISRRAVVGNPVATLRSAIAFATVGVLLDWAWASPTPRYGPKRPVR